MRQAVLILVVAVVMPACTVRYAYTPTRGQAAAKPATCDVALYTTRPEQRFEELGVLDHDPASPAARTASAFLENVRPQVCAAGGDGVLTEVNGYGMYVRGTIIRFLDGARSTLTPEPGRI